MKFTDRVEAGKILAEQLIKRGYDKDSVVLALPRGGIPVGYEVATRLGLPLDVLVVRKLGFPGHEEFAMGAIASGGTIVLDHNVIRRAGIPQEVLDSVIAKEDQELQRRDRAYRDGRPRLSVGNRSVILVDDGLATGSTMRAAIRALRKEGPRRISVAVPVGAPETCELLTTEADDVLCAVAPEPFHAVGMWYQDFSQTTDEEVSECLRKAHEQQPAGSGLSAASGMGTDPVLL